MLAQGIQLLPQSMLHASQPPQTATEKKDGPQLGKSNILLLGPTGCGELSVTFPHLSPLFLPFFIPTFLFLPPFFSSSFPSSFVSSSSPSSSPSFFPSPSPLLSPLFSSSSLPLPPSIPSLLPLHPLSQNLPLSPRGEGNFALPIRSQYH